MFIYFYHPPSIEVLKERLKNRGSESEESLKKIIESGRRNITKSEI